MKFTIFAVLLLSVAACRAELDTSDISNRLDSMGINPEHGEAAVEQGQKVFEEQCRKYGGESAVENSKLAQEEVVQCVMKLINITEVQKEMDIATPQGELDAVFKKYCRKSPQLLDCATNLSRSIEPCLPEDQKRVTTILQDVTKTVLNFTCFKEGDRIALFIAEGGPDCLKNRSEGMQLCVNKTFGKYAEHLPSLDANITDINQLNFPLFLFNEAQCNEIDEVFQCVVKVLEECKDPTPANVMESIFKVVRRVIPCDHQKGTTASTVGPNGRSSSLSLYASIPSLLLALLLARM